MSDNGSRDVVIVGGGIGGGALGTTLARGGLDVLLLEKQKTYRDKVRGETLNAWGVAEAQKLGVVDTLLAAGGSYGTRMVPYDEVQDPAMAEANSLPMDVVVPGVPGALNVGHPQACEALTLSAADAGATVLRGVTNVRIDDGTVSYSLDGAEHVVRTPMIVGADGRHSTVRAHAGIALEESTPRTMGGGVLVGGLREWPKEREAVGTEDDVLFLIFARAGGFARLYLMWDIAQRDRFNGPDRTERFVEHFRLKCAPPAHELADAEVVSPYAAYPMTDAWTTEPPVRDGLALIGDAAGWNDPIIGQGLAITMRDARSVADVLLGGTDRSAGAFAGYVEERAERMRRLRITAMLATELRATFTPEGRERRRRWFEKVAGGDFSYLAPIAATAMGPDRIGADAFGPESIEKILSV